MIGPAMLYERCHGAHTDGVARWTLRTYSYRGPGPKSLRSRWTLARQARNKRRNRR